MATCIMRYVETPTRMAYTAREVAQLLALSQSQVWNLLADGTIPSFKIGKSRRVRHEDLIAFIGSIDSGKAAS